MPGLAARALGRRDFGKPARVRGQVIDPDVVQPACGRCCCSGSRRAGQVALGRGRDVDLAVVDREAEQRRAERLGGRLHVVELGERAPAVDQQAVADDAAGAAVALGVSLRLHQLGDVQADAGRRAAWPDAGCLGRWRPGSPREERRCQKHTSGAPSGDGQRAYSISHASKGKQPSVVPATIASTPSIAWVGIGKGKRVGNGALGGGPLTTPSGSTGRRC